jgi:hypothetical protein
MPKRLPRVSKKIKKQLTDDWKRMQGGPPTLYHPKEPEYPPFDTEIDTGCKCAACEGYVVAYHTEYRPPRTGFSPGVPNPLGLRRHIQYQTKYYCNVCQILYNAPPKIL